MQLFGTAGQAKLFCPGTKGQRDRSSFIVPGQRDKGTRSKSCHRTGRSGTAKIRDGTAKLRDGTRDRAEKGCSKTEKDVLKQENDVLKQENDVLKQEYDVLKQEMWSFLKNPSINFVPGRPGTEGFVPGHLLLPLSRDKGTAGQAKLFCPGTKGQRDREIFLSRDKGTTGRPVPVCPRTSRGTSRPLETLH